MTTTAIIYATTTVLRIGLADESVSGMETMSITLQAKYGAEMEAELNWSAIGSQNTTVTARFGARLTQAATIGDDLVRRVRAGATITQLVDRIYRHGLADFTVNSIVAPDWSWNVDEATEGKQFFHVGDAS